MHEPLTDEERALLREAADAKFACLDLRYEGGPYVRVLDRLAARDLLTSETGEPGYFASYRVTDAGRALLAASTHRST